MSIVVASFSGESRLRSCLDSLEPEHGGSEVIVSAALDPETVEALRHHYRWAQFVPAPPRSSVFRLRALGLARASGSLAVLLEDHCVVPPGWLRSLAAVPPTDRGYAGGAVESGRGSSIRDWALYLVEYGALIPPVAAGASAVLAVNAAYPREALQACRSVWADGFHDHEVHEALRAAGHAPRVVAEATVRSHLRLPVSRAAAHLFQGGRRFGAYRWRRWSRVQRVLRILAAPVVPALLLARIAGRLARRRPASSPADQAPTRPSTCGRASARRGNARGRRRALPHVLGLVGAWSAGELAGHLRPGREGAGE